MNSNRIILIGAGGHCISCIDVIEENSIFIIKGILDPFTEAKSILGYPVIGTDELIPSLIKENFNFLITVGQIKSGEIRKRLFDSLIKASASIPTIISSRAYVSKHAKIGLGTIIHHNTIVNAGVEIGDNCIINSGSIIEHNSKIGNNCHISTNVVINGDCKIGTDVFIGSGTVISNNISIIEKVIIGAGGLVFRNISEPGTYFSKSGLNRKIS